MGIQVYDERKPYQIKGTITPSDGTGPSCAIDGSGHDNWRADAILMRSDDTIDHLVDLWFYFNTAFPTIEIPHLTINVPAGAGCGTVPAVDLLAAGLPSSIVTLSLMETTNIAIGVQVAVSENKTMSFILLGALL